MSSILSNVRIIELGGLAPVPFCGKILSDFGASVLRIEKQANFVPKEVLNSDKLTVSLDLKDNKDRILFKKLIKTTDVLLDPYRPGILERLELSPDILRNINSRLIIARLTGYGQPQQQDTELVRQMRLSAGHDINYVAMSGLLSRLGKGVKNNNNESGCSPFPSINILGDMAGGAALCAFGVVLALLERSSTGHGTVIDCSMTHGVKYLATFVARSMRHMPFIWPKLDHRGANVLDGGAPFYRTYQTKDNKWIAVGAIEPQFYSQFLKIIEVNESDAPQFSIERWDELTEKFSSKIVLKTRDEWAKRIEQLGGDSCITPVLDIDEADKYWSENDDETVQPRFESSSNMIKNVQKLNKEEELTRWLESKSNIDSEEKARLLKAML